MNTLQRTIQITALFAIVITIVLVAILAQQVITYHTAYYGCMDNSIIAIASECHNHAVRMVQALPMTRLVNTAIMFYAGGS